MTAGASWRYLQTFDASHCDGSAIAGRGAVRHRLRDISSGLRLAILRPGLGGSPSTRRKQRHHQVDQ